MNKQDTNKQTTTWPDDMFNSCISLQGSEHFYLNIFNDIFLDDNICVFSMAKDKISLLLTFDNKLNV